MYVSFYTQKFVVYDTGSKNLVVIYRFFDLIVGPIFKIILLDTVRFLGCFSKKCCFRNGYM